MKAHIPKAGPHKPNITVDPSLDEKYAGKTFCPKKLEKAKETLAKHGLPKGWGKQ